MTPTTKIALEVGRPSEQDCKNKGKPKRYVQGKSPLIYFHFKKMGHEFDECFIIIHVSFLYWEAIMLLHARRNNSSTKMVEFH
jgi:hypothetical protein